MARSLRRDDGISTIVGGIIILALMGLALLYVNGVHVPNQGESMEVAAGTEAEEALRQIAASLALQNTGPSVHATPLQPPRGDPPLLAGLVLEPLRAQGSLAFDADAPLLTVSAVVDAPAGGVPANDPVRQDAGGGKMRIFLLGNATAGQPLGSLSVRTGGAYLAPSEYRLEGGALHQTREGGSVSVSPPALSVRRAGTPTGPTTAVAWVVPILAGSDAEVAGSPSAIVGLTPGPSSTVGGGSLVYDLTIRVDTPRVAAWTSALQAVVGASGFVNATASGAPDNGTVTAIVLAPPGTAPSARAVEMQLWAVRYEIQLAQLAGG